MALHFQNLYSNTVYIAFLYYDACCGGTPFKKMGWWQVNSGQILTPWNVDLRTVGRHAAFFAEEFRASGGATWSGTGNNWYLISEAVFWQCYDDNTNCNQQPDFVPLDFDGFYDMSVILGPAAGKMDIKGSAPKRHPP